MAERQFPSNVHGEASQGPLAGAASPNPTPEREKKVEKLEGLGEVLIKKPSLGQRFKNNFFGGDAKSAVSGVWSGVLVPALQNMLLDAIQQGSEKIVVGEVRTKSRNSTLPWGMQGLGHQAYNKMFAGPEPGRAQQITQRQARATHNFQEFVLTTRPAAELVVDRMYDLLSRDGAVTVADFMDLMGEDADYTMQKWGWIDLRGSQVVRVPQGYLIDLPRPIPLD